MPTASLITSDRREPKWGLRPARAEASLRMNIRPDLRSSVSAVGLNAGFRARATSQMSAMRRAAVERIAGMGRDDDLHLALQLRGEAGREAAEIALGDIEGQAQRWRERLTEQGHRPEQVERLVREYRTTALLALQRRAMAARA